uniref:Uncharacterized protein LOC102807455 n=1 Tax=Saccoglossus kowalevskii TaxID=10224 RepID=A0ABM0MMN4_SACKO|nr:PREDICTED: uncharacterized protein LOC102807455 [Saccoglossus kowalevskii]
MLRRYTRRQPHTMTPHVPTSPSSSNASNSSISPPNSPLASPGRCSSPNLSIDSTDMATLQILNDLQLSPLPNQPPSPVLSCPPSKLLTRPIPNFTAPPNLVAPYFSPTFDHGYPKRNTPSPKPSTSASYFEHNSAPRATTNTPSSPQPSTSAAYFDSHSVACATSPLPSTSAFRFDPKHVDLLHIFHMVSQPNFSPPEYLISDPKAKFDATSLRSHLQRFWIAKIQSDRLESAIQMEDFPSNFYPNTPLYFHDQEPAFIQEWQNHSLSFAHELREISFAFAKKIEKQRFSDAILCIRQFFDINPDLTHFGVIIKIAHEAFSHVSKLDSDGTLDPTNPLCPSDWYTTTEPRQRYTNSTRTHPRQSKNDGAHPPSPTIQSAPTKTTTPLSTRNTYDPPALMSLHIPKPKRLHKNLTKLSRLKHANPRNNN